MHIRYFQDFDSMSQAGFDLVKQAVEAKPDLLFCVASGGSPAGLYAKMVSEKAKNPAFCSALRVIKLDEWGGLEAGSTFTSEYDVQTKMVQPMGIAPDRYWTIDPWTPDPDKACAGMQAVIEEQGPIDICILGIGVNGHIALNEPGEVLRPEFHVCALAESTLNNGMIKALKQPPTFGMTMGVGNILQSKKILLFVAGSGKKEAFKRLLQPEVSTQFPASLLWLHPDVDVLVDKWAI